MYYTGVLLCIRNEWQAPVRPLARALTLFLAIAHFLFTRLTNVGVFVELVASAIDTCGDADDDRIYNNNEKNAETKCNRMKWREKNNWTTWNNQTKEEKKYTFKQI